MHLTDWDEAEVRYVHRTSPLAIDLLPLLRKYAHAGELDKIPEAIRLFVSITESGRRDVREYLTDRIPSLVVNCYWADQVTYEPDYHKLMFRYTDDPSIRSRIIDGVTTSRLAEVVAELKEEVLG